MVARLRESAQMNPLAVPEPLGPVPRPKIQKNPLFGVPRWSHEAILQWNWILRKAGFRTHAEEQLWLKPFQLNILLKYMGPCLGTEE